MHESLGMRLQVLHMLALFQASPKHEYVYGIWYFFCVGPEQKGNILWVVQPTMCSTLGVCGIRPPITRYAL